MAVASALPLARAVLDVDAGEDTAVEAEGMAVVNDEIVEIGLQPDRCPALLVCWFSVKMTARLDVNATPGVRMFYLRVGRYAEASDANVEAILADEDYISQCQAQGLYPIGYYPHNIHFLWASSSLEGRSEVAIDAAEKTASRVPIDMAKAVPNLQWFLATPTYALVRFGRWSEVLTMPPPAADMPFLTGTWHYARGVAFAARNQLERADEELAALLKIAAMPEIEKMTLNSATGTHILNLAAEIVAGEVAAKSGDTDKSVEHMSNAVELQDDLQYMEPPTWHYPVRHSLGAVLLDAGRLEDSEAVYRKSLENWTDNGWSLFGLLQTLRAQGRTREADEVEKKFEKAWSRADITLTSSRF